MYDIIIREHVRYHYSRACTICNDITTYYMLSKDRIYLCQQRIKWKILPDKKLRYAILFSALPSALQFYLHNLCTFSIMKMAVQNSFLIFFYSFDS